MSQSTAITWTPRMNTLTVVKIDVYSPCFFTSSTRKRSRIRKVHTIKDVNDTTDGAYYYLGLATIYQTLTDKNISLANAAEKCLYDSIAAVSQGNELWV